MLFPGIFRGRATHAVPLAMQKVEGSSPFSRSSQKPRKSGVFCNRSVPGASGERWEWVASAVGDE